MKNRDNDLRIRFLELLKQTLTYSFWEEPPRLIERFEPGLELPLRLACSGLQPLLRRKGMGICRLFDGNDEDRTTGTFWPSQAHTMVGIHRLNQLQAGIETILTDGVPGDLIETGVWRGGASILMKGVLSAFGDTNRRLFVADSFAGLPAPSPDRFPADCGDEHFLHPELAVSRETVEANFRKFGLLDERVIIVEGWFGETLGSVDSDCFSLIRLDGDMYQSTWESLQILYPKLSSGGFCVIDDFALRACRQAVLDYRQQEGIESEITRIDWTGVYWRKP